jgi:hypothetical protein
VTPAGETVPGIAEGFRRLRPWVTRFRIGDAEYGGRYRAWEDPRIGQFFGVFPDVRSILELGALEGGHSFELAKRDGIVVTAVEGREENIRRAEYARGLVGGTNVTFVHANLEDTPLRSFGRFDAVLNSGVLYHLPRPWMLVDQLREVAPRAFIWTQVVEPHRATDVFEGHPGRFFDEGGIFPRLAALVRSDRLRGLSRRSFWVTLPWLVERLRAGGFTDVEVLAEARTPNGASATIAAWDAQEVAAGV